MLTIDEYLQTDEESLIETSQQTSPIKSSQIDIEDNVSTYLPTYLLEMIV